MPRLIRLYICQSLIGVGVATIFVGLLLALDVAGLWYLVTHTRIGPFAALLLWAHFAIVFAGVQFAISVMRLADAPVGGHDDERPDGGHWKPAPGRQQTRVSGMGRKQAPERDD